MSTTNAGHSKGYGRSSLLVKFNEAQAQLVVQTADLPLGTLADMVEDKAIDLEPGFQRRERWGVEKQSALIESFLLNVPVPPVYLAEEEQGTYTAIDGKQRLKAITEFIQSRFKLKGLERIPEAEGLLFKDLPSPVANSLRIRPSLRVVTLLKQSDPILKYEVFLRLNRGGEVLNSQEIRNVAYRGPLNNSIYTLAANEVLRRQLKITDEKASAYRSMGDAEYVLRFLTLAERYQRFSGSFGDEMNNFMKRYQNASEHTIRQFEDSFVTAITRCDKLWRQHAFRRVDGAGWRDQLLAGMYDAQMLAVTEISDQQFNAVLARREEVLTGTRSLFIDSNFDKAVRTGTNTPGRIQYRVDQVRKLLLSIAK